MTDDYPPELEGQAQAHNTLAARVQVAGLPSLDWSWASWASMRKSESVEKAGTMLQKWSMGQGHLRGVLLHGGAGIGKTGMTCSIIREAAEAGTGRMWAWNLATAPKVVAAVISGDFRRRPAPAIFYRWRDLKSLLDRAKVGQTPWDEMPPLTAEKVLQEIDDRCSVLALDDIDVDALTPWKEEILLRLLDLPLSGCRVIITMNANPASQEGIARLGERIVDRLMDPQLFVRFHLTGDSIRRRKRT